MTLAGTAAAAVMLALWDAPLRRPALRWSM